jgi:hypothetical protein
VLLDGDLLPTDAASEGQRAFQLFRLNVGVRAEGITTVRVQWAGRGTSGVVLSVWNAANGSWSLLSANPAPSGQLIENAIPDPASVVSSAGDVWVMVDSAYDAGSLPTVATDFIGLALSYQGAPSSGSCTVCHAMHGATVDGVMSVGQVVANESRLCTGEGGTGCHGVDAAGASDIASKIAGADPRMSHDLRPESQVQTGAKIRCSDCHNPHADNATAPHADPDDISIAATIGLGTAVDPDGDAYMLIGAKHDGIAPVISNSTFDSAGERALAPLLTWVTDEKATTWVEWGVSPGVYDSSAGSDALEYTHSISMSDLVAGQTYYYRIRSTDALGNVGYGDETLYTAFAPPSTPAVIDIYYQDTEVPVAASGGGYSPLLFTVTGTPLLAPEGDTVEYEFELLVAYAWPGFPMSSGWRSSPSWNGSPGWGEFEYNLYQFRVRARYASYPEVVSGWSTLSRQFSYEIYDYWSSSASAPSEGTAVALSSSALEDELRTEEAGTSVEASWLDAHEPIEYYTPGLYSVDSNYISLAVQKTDGTVTYLSPSEGWQSASAAESTPTPSAPGDPVDTATLLKASAVDTEWWQTSLAERDGDFNWQVARFDLSEIGLGNVRQVTYVWRGHGEPTPGYPTVVQAWNAESGSWTLVTSDSLSTDTDVGHSVTASNATSMCLRCHDGLPPDGVVLPAGMPSLATAWTSAVGDFHGARPGIGFGSAGVKTPYTRSSGAIECTVCHDAHGTSNVYHIPSAVNGREGIVAKDGDELWTVCVSCHEGSIDAWHAPCVACHLGAESHWAGWVDPAQTLEPALPSMSSDCTSCHGHGRSWTHPATCLRCHGEAELRNLNAAPDSPWTYGRTF